MATIMAGGGRRSAAPTYTPFSPMQSNAGTMDPELMLRELLRAAPAPSAQQLTPLGGLSEAFARGTLTNSGQGNSASFGSGPPGSLPGAGNAFGGLGLGLSSLGVAAKDGNMVKAGGMIGTLGGLMSAKDANGVARALGPVAASKIGLPGGLVGFGLSAMDGNLAGMATSALSMANPMAGLVNAVSSMFGGPTVGNVVNAAQVANNANIGFGTAYNVNRNPDPMGALMGATDAFGTAPTATSRDSGSFGGNSFGSGNRGGGNRGQGNAGMSGAGQAGNSAGTGRGTGSSGQGTSQA